MVIEMKEIAQFILQKLGDRIHKEKELGYVITIDGKVFTRREYYSLLEEHSNVPPAYIYVMDIKISQWVYKDPMWYNLYYYYPFITLSEILLGIYLKKYYYYKNQLGKLKYMAIITHFSLLNKTIMEVTDIEYVANKMNLQDLLQVLNKKKENKKNEGVAKFELDFDEEDDEKERIVEFAERYRDQRLFNGYSFREVIRIFERYYGDNDSSLANDIKAISDGYRCVFQPYRVELSPN